MTFFIERPVATTMIFLVLLFLGLASFFDTPLELAPSEDSPQVTVSASWPDVPPLVVQNRLTAPLEETVLKVRGVRNISSISKIGQAQITVDFDPTLNMEFVNLALREELAAIRESLPAGVQQPLQVESYVPDNFGGSALLSYSISGSYSLQNLYDLVKRKLELGLGAIPGVARAEVSGGAAPEIKVVLKPERMQALGIQPQQVSSALQTRLQIYPAGRISKRGQEFIFKLENAPTTDGQIGETIVAHSGNHPVALNEVAAIGNGYGEINRIERINGKPTVRLTITKEKGANSLHVSRAVQEKLAALLRQLPSDLVFRLVDDESKILRRNLDDLYRLAGIIILVVFFMILLVLRRVGASLLILSSVAFSVVITFILIHFLKISLNMLTLGALALGFGMFVDDSIVVFEHILRLRERGLEPRQAALRGAREVFVAVLASTLTTISVFFCFPFFQGRLRIYYLPLAIVIASALAASLLVSFTLIPALSLRLLGADRKIRLRQPSGRFDRLLGFTLRHPLEVMVLVLALLFGSYHWFKANVNIGGWYRGERESDRLSVNIEMPAGTALEKTEEVIRAFEERALALDCGREVSTSLSAEYASLVIRFPQAVVRTATPYLLRQELIQVATQSAGITIWISGFDPQGYYSSGSIGSFSSSRIDFLGYNLKKLREIGADLEKTLHRSPRVRDVRITSSQGFNYGGGESSETVLHLDKEQARRFDIDSSSLAVYLGNLLPQASATTITLINDGREIPLVVKFPGAKTVDIRQLLEHRIRTGSNEYLRLGEIARLEEIPIPGSIDRVNQQFRWTVSWEYLGSSKATERYQKAIFANLQLPPGFSAQMDYYRDFMTGEERGQVKWAIIISLLIIFMIVASLYESFIHPFFILFAVPLAMIGVFAAFVVVKFPFDSSAYIGIIILEGIVVKNAILLVDHINLKRSQGLDLLAAVIEGTRDRIRPIFMTTSSTVCGILPLLLIRAQEGVVKRQIWSTLALCTVGGLISSTILLLLVMPVFYYYGEGLRHWLHAKFLEIKQALTLGK